MNRRKAVYALLCIILITIVIVLFSIGRHNPFKEKHNVLRIQAKSINGDTISTDQLKDKPTVLIFFNTQCELCLAEILLLKRYLGQILKFYQVFFISFEPKASLSTFFLDEGVNINLDNIYVISDDKMSLLDFYDIEGYPSFLVFDKGGALLYKGEAIDDNVLQRLLKK